MASCRSIAALTARLAAAGAGVDPGGWLRAWGYDDALLRDGRHPTRHDLDAAVAAVPTVVHHRTGHVAVLNSEALRLVDLDHHPDGVLVDAHDVLGRVPRIDEQQLTRAAATVSAEWAARGVGAFTDATHTNGPADLELLGSWCGDGTIGQQVVAMVGVEHLAGVPAFGERLGAVTVGHAKVMPADDAGDIDGNVAQATGHGFPAAVHVMDVDTLETTLGAFEAHPPPTGTHHHLEHNALCLPEQVPRIAASGARVVVNPSFLVHRAAKYRRELSTVEREWLVRIRSLVEAGVAVRAGSDSPVVPSDPAEMLAAAVHRELAPAEAVDAAAAARLLEPWPEWPGEYGRRR